MSNPFVAEVRIFGFNFAPTGWATCDGQILPISQNTALFSLLGTNYGGNGQSTFALPDMQDAACMHPGQGPGLSEYVVGEMGGSEFVTLLVSEMPAHSHGLMCSVQPSSTGTPSAQAGLARGFGGSPFKATPFTNSVNMAPQTLTPAGGSLPHNNMMPYLTMNYCIALQGVFPPRT
jgi:microcystin-dependent protein